MFARTARHAVALLVGLTAPLLVLPAQTAVAAVGQEACHSPLFSGVVRAQDVTGTKVLDAVATRNNQSVKVLNEIKTDPTLWFDSCGMEFYREPLNPNAGDTTGGAVTASASTVLPATTLRPLSDTFLLESKPGSSRTIYLDFDGGTVTGTAWNNTYGSTITVAPYSITAPVDTNFSNAELTEIQKIWQIVAEDYAPFDVNVTTRDLGAAALERTDSYDLVYGNRVMFTADGPIYTACSCGGIAYVGVFNFVSPSHLYYQPAFAFTNGVGVYAKNLGEVASHEAGHNFGLNHDGNASSGYDYGNNTWAPIMGAGYYRPVSQWSKGDYPGANNTQDDLAVIATGAPLRVDDHGDTAGTGTPMVPGQPVNGVINTRTDVDAFTFTVSGDTTVSVTPADGQPDLDVQLQIRDASGAVIDTVNPAATYQAADLATGLGATWTGNLTLGTYTAVVDGIGTGDPATSGYYDDYASLGNYQISLTGTAPSVPLTVTAQNVPTATVSTAYNAAAVTVSGGSGSYTYSASNLAPGLSVDATSGSLAGIPTTAGTWNTSVTVTDTLGQSSTVVVAVTVSALFGFTTSATLPQATAKTSYSTTIAITGGTPGYTWTRSGSLPSGLSLKVASNGLSAQLSGKPNVRGTFSFTVTVTDSTGQATSRRFTISVK